MTILKMMICLVAMGIVTLIIGYFITRREGRKRDFDESIIFMRELIKSSELSVTAYQNILEAFREFDSISYRDEKVYQKVLNEFLFKYRDFLPKSEERKIKIIPDGSEGYYNYKIQID